AFSHGLISLLLLRQMTVNRCSGKRTRAAAMPQTPPVNCTRFKPRNSPRGSRSSTRPPKLVKRELISRPRPRCRACRGHARLVSRALALYPTAGGCPALRRRRAGDDGLNMQDPLVDPTDVPLLPVALRAVRPGVVAAHTTGPHPAGDRVAQRRPPLVRLEPVVRLRRVGPEVAQGVALEVVRGTAFGPPPRERVVAV